MSKEHNKVHSTEEMLSYKLFLQREQSVFHLPYEREMQFYHAVKNGDAKKLSEIMLPLKNEQLGKLSEDPVRNLQYHLTITISMITRFCIEGGLPPETAYTLSDLYIQQLDKCKTEDELTSLHYKIVLEYTNRMRKIRKKNLLSRPVLKTMDYIYNHLQEKIRLDELAQSLGFHKTYLCDLFKKETDMTIGTYITKRKIEAAQNMLIYTEYSPADISNYFSFSSHSHFIHVFKKETGMTPTEYQKRYYRHHFENENNEDATISDLASTPFPETDSSAKI